MSCCSLKHCRARISKNLPQLTLHQFPKCESKRRCWLDVIGIDNLNPKHKDWHVCSVHFDETCFNRTFNVVRLRDDAVPSIFDVIPYDTDTIIKDESGDQDYQVSKFESETEYCIDYDSEDFSQKYNIKQPRLEFVQFHNEEIVEEAINEEYKAVGVNVAFKLQRMKIDQRYYAELLINKVLINGLKNKLSDETDLVGL